MMQEWEDLNLRWPPEQYGGINEIYVPTEEIWVPDIVLYNKLVTFTCHSTQITLQPLTIRLLNTAPVMYIRIIPILRWVLNNFHAAHMWYLFQRTLFSN